MALIKEGSFPESFNFIENPVVVNVGDFKFDPKATFKQATIKVEVTSYVHKDVSEYFFYADASEQDVISVDISTALRASMNEYYPTTGEVVGDGKTYSYPMATFSVTAWERSLYDGMVWEENYSAPRLGKAYYGGFSEYERYTTKHPAEIFPEASSAVYITRKPEDGEVIETGMWRMYSWFSDEEFRSYSRKLTTSNEGTKESDAGGVFWHEPNTGTRVQFAFVNSLGVIETITAQTKESHAYQISSERKSLTSSPAYKPNPGITTHKTGGRGVFSMSSGPVSRAWADWWTTEFLMAKHYWMLMEDGSWLPVTVQPSSDETLIYNKAEQSLLHVDFDVQASLGGSILNKLRMKS